MENNRQNRKDSLINLLLEKYQECHDESFGQIAIHHFNTYANYFNLLPEKGDLAFPNRLEFMRFQVAKLFIDRMKLLEFSLDPSVKGFGEYKDCTLPPLEAFSMTPDVIETRKIRFLRNIDRGDLLNLRVVEFNDNEHIKMLVINKYNENERISDYLIYAYMIKTHQLDKLPRSLKVGDLMRAAVLGKLKMEGNRFSRFLVTVNDNIVNDKYKHLDLGLVFESEIPFYPVDISNYKSFLNFMKADRTPDNPKELLKCMSSLGIDPYKTYSFHGASNGKKLGVPKEPRSEVELKSMEKSMSLVKESEKQLIQGVDRVTLLPMLEEALRIYPLNDAAYAVRGQLYKSIYVDGKNDEFILKALNDFEKALDLNGYNVIATREYLTLLALSAELFKHEGNTPKSEEIMQILARCKDICDITTMQLVANNAEQNQS